jgi:DNA-nicking Smr family endonuclease
MSTRRRRTLTGDEVALWSHVTRHVSPMPGRSRPEPPAPPGPAQPAEPPPAASPAPAGRSKAPAKAAPTRLTPPPATPVPPLAPLERRLRQRLARGHHPIDAVIDLHGMRQDEAHVALRGFLAGAQRTGFSVVLVVTGKGGASASAGHLFEERGVLRRVVPHWLRLPDLRSVVVGFEEAAGHHGGGGALYVRLRKARQGGAL